MAYTKLLTQPVIKKFEEIRLLSKPLAIAFLVVILLLALSLFIVASRYIKEVFQLRTSEILKEEIKKAIEEKDSLKLRRLILDFLNFYDLGSSSEEENRKRILVLKRKLENYHNLSIDTILELVKELEKEILNDRDEEAKKVIRKAVLQTAFSTAASPIALIDASIVIWKSWFLIKEIAMIYGFRPNILNTALLFKLSFRNMFEVVPYFCTTILPSIVNLSPP